MRKDKIYLSIFIAAAWLFLAGCAADKGEEPPSEAVTNEGDGEEETNEQADKANTTDEEKESTAPASNEEIWADLPEVPEDAAGFINQPKGKYPIYSSDWTDEQKEELKADVSVLEPLPKEASEEEYDRYFQYVYSLVAEDFPDPQDVIKKWEFGSFGDPDLPDARFHFKENYNVEVLLDASGSMGAYIGDKTMMDIAKEAIDDFMQQVPEEANVSFRVYGHKGTGDNSDKELSCSAIEQVYGYEPYKEETFQQELEKIEPAGWTPLAAALQEAEASLQEYDTENNTNLIYVVSDGVETCGGDPVEVARSLADSGAKPIINIIGFNVDTEAQQQLKEMADVSGGIFAEANDQEELQEEFDRAEEVLEAWDDWKKDALKDIDAKRVRHSFDRLGYTNEWGQKTTRMFNNISRASRALYKAEIIDVFQLDKFNARRNDVEKNLKQAKRELKEELENISADNIESMREAIKEKYDKQTTE
ncbi:VWA domain-containing protein [Bacillus piscicola]|uniref:VWA domain-containing protein n=1 Tax=Bacillus piscicola TaxID=1632684 RepID=UPI001F090E64|nr:VWA domain-containing protein [Bacillus piscicola]